MKSSIKEKEKKLSDILGEDIEQQKIGMLGGESRIKSKSNSMFYDLIASCRMMNDAVFALCETMTSLEKEPDQEYKIPAFMGFEVVRNEEISRDLVIKGEYGISQKTIRSVMEYVFTLKHIVREGKLDEWLKYQEHRSSLYNEDIRSPYGDQEEVPRIFSSFEVLFEEEGAKELYDKVYRQFSTNVHPSLAIIHQVVDLESPIERDEKRATYPVVFRKEFNERKGADLLYVGEQMLVYMFLQLKNVLEERDLSADLDIDLEKLHELVMEIHVLAKIASEDHLQQ